jgi:hypothetical protein
MTETNSNYPKSLLKIIEGIECSKLIDNNVLVDIVRQSNLIEKDFLPYNKLDHPIEQSYGRNNIYEGTNYSIFLMSWSSGDFTGIHSHGLSDWGAVYFFGNMDHRLYNASGKKIELAQKGIVPEGSVVPVKGSLVHAMGNLGEKPVLTLHIYGWRQPNSNANDNSFVYELEKKQIRTTDGSAFINIADKLCKKTEKGIIANTETVTDYFEIINPFYIRNKNKNMDNYIKKVLKNPELYLTLDSLV